ncbi:hypothetical protein I7I48_05722 [Histoplasma ohiense]|nr:hypothetical protein I7I48_05722 [Histoplasma ohiense (nom. inval.)]
MLCFRDLFSSSFVYSFLFLCTVLLPSGGGDPCGNNIGWEQCRAWGLLSLFLASGDTSIYLALPSYRAQSKLDFLLSMG